MKFSASALLISAVLACVPGCSMLFQQHLSSPPRPLEACVDSSPMPIVDTTVGSVAMVAAAVGAYYAYSHNHENYVLPSGATAVGAVIVLGSAREGFGWEQRCRDRSGVAVR